MIYGTGNNNICNRKPHSSTAVFKLVVQSASDSIVLYLLLCKTCCIFTNLFFTLHTNLQRNIVQWYVTWISWFNISQGLWFQSDYALYTPRETKIRTACESDTKWVFQADFYLPRPRFIFGITLKSATACTGSITKLAHSLLYPLTVATFHCLTQFTEHLFSPLQVGPVHIMYIMQSLTSVMGAMSSHWFRR